MFEHIFLEISVPFDFIPVFPEFSVERFALLGPSYGNFRAISPRFENFGQMKSAL